MTVTYAPPHQHAYTETGINLQAVNLDIQGKRILNQLSFQSDVPRLGIIGRNGSGKSTLSRVLSGLLAVDSGAVTLAGINPETQRKQALQEVGLLFQNPDHQIIFPTVLEEMVFGLRQLGQKKSEATQYAFEILEQFGKSHWKDAHTASLSQGQKHLLCLMAVVAMRPKLIILDEPFAGLDIPTKKQLQRYLDRFPGKLIHISHDPSDIEHYEQIVWLEAGQLERIGSPNDVLPHYLNTMNTLGDSDDISDLAG
ncbi:energy-coupling factor ABC transporter ATP-binding protein [Vibrio palustris]|uniref:Biotin transport ATP-binding protein BioM n=1 Tax=Vibrio palustris TaxID=1918946 RepID=A0A1R4B131_9VIBR|nr:ABC transporter ATP-binding protein [Vibrio palustris]SJL82613.1 Biotin transport ATP-binding protein BioM [Vibrio palustris]